MKGLTAKVYEIKVLPNTIEELVVAIFDQTGKDKISRQDALDMADFLEREKYNPKPPKFSSERFGPIHKVA